MLACTFAMAVLLGEYKTACQTPPITHIRKTGRPITKSVHRKKKYKQKTPTR
jgi:hypothetical protein